MKDLVRSSRGGSRICPKCSRRRVPLRTNKVTSEHGWRDGQGEWWWTRSRGGNRGGFAVAATDSSSSQPYGPLEWRNEAVSTDCRSLLIGPGATHIIEALSLSNAVVIDTVSGLRKYRIIVTSCLHPLTRQ